MDEAHWTERRNLRTHHSSTGSGTEHQILQQAHHQARNQMTDAEYAIQSQKLWTTSYQDAKH